MRTCAHTYIHTYRQQAYRAYKKRARDSRCAYTQHAYIHTYTHTYSKLTGHKSSVRVILDVPTLNGMLTGSLDTTMVLWDKFTGKKRKTVCVCAASNVCMCAYMYVCISGHDYGLVDKFTGKKRKTVCVCAASNVCMCVYMYVYI